MNKRKLLLLLSGPGVAMLRNPRLSPQGRWEGTMTYKRKAMVVASVITLLAATTAMLTTACSHQRRTSWQICQEFDARGLVDNKHRDANDRVGCSNESKKEGFAELWDGASEATRFHPAGIEGCQPDGPCEKSGAAWLGTALDSVAVDIRIYPNKSRLEARWSADDAATSYKWRDEKDLAIIYVEGRTPSDDQKRKWGDVVAALQ